MRIRSTTPVRLLHGLVLLPSGISRKMTVTLDLTTIIAMLVASFYLCLLVVRSIDMSCYLPLVISCLPYCHVKPLTHLPSKPLFGYVTAFAQPLL